MSYQIAHHFQYASEGVLGVSCGVVRLRILFEPGHGKAGAPSEDSDQTGHLPSLVRVFNARIKNLEVISYMLSELRIL